MSPNDIKGKASLPVISQEDGKRANPELPLCFYSPSQTFLLKQIAQKSDHPLKR